MTLAQWRQVDQLFHEALERPPELRVDFLKQACKGDQALFRELQSLLSSHEQAGSFIEKSPSDIAAQFLADEKHELLPGGKLGQIRDWYREPGCGARVSHWQADWALPDCFPNWRGRDGRSLSGHRHAAQSDRRD